VWNRHPESSTESASVDAQAAIQPRTTPVTWWNQEGNQHIGSLLIFVPRDAIGRVIDSLTGKYGYSHMAIDCGEYDGMSGKRLMIEATAAGVHQVFQDKYGTRKFVRIPLKQTGVDVGQFCDCVRSKLGETYDEEEALTFGIIDNPAKQICSDLVTVCLPETIRADIAHRHTNGHLQPRSAIRVNGKLNASFRLFVSPNGFAEYFGAPRGELLHAQTQVSKPGLRASGWPHWQFRSYQLLGIATLCGLAVAWIIMKQGLRKWFG
jgi:hypothetical protein